MANPKARLNVKQITAVALVDKGDNPKADFLLFKRAPMDVTDERGPEPQADAVAPSLFKRLLALLTGKTDDEVAKAWDEAVTYDEVKEEREEDRRRWWEVDDVMREVWAMTTDLADAINRTMRDRNAEDRGATLRASIDQFHADALAAAATWDRDLDEVTKEGRKISAGRLSRLTAARDAITALIDETNPTTKEEPVAEPTTKIDPGATGADEDVLKGASAEVRALIEKMRSDTEAAKTAADQALAKAAAAEESAAVATLTKRATAGDLAGLPGIARAETIAALREIEKTAPPEAFQKLAQVLAGSAAIVQKSALFKEIGSAGAGGGTATAKIDADAAKLREADPTLTVEKAFSAALKANPELYAEYVREQESN